MYLVDILTPKTCPQYFSLFLVVQTQCHSGEGCCTSMRIKGVNDISGDKIQVLPHAHKENFTVPNIGMSVQEIHQRRVTAGVEEGVARGEIMSTVVQWQLEHRPERKTGWWLSTGNKFARKWRGRVHPLPPDLLPTQGEGDAIDSTALNQ